tara:strand:+ start:472 stop:804 length:333 start_codon:yes stop_codon:yes gene_type:complete
MGFVRKKVKVFPWPVEVRVPSSDKAGTFETSKFTAKFYRLKRTELEGFDELEEIAALTKILAGWSEITEEDGSDVPFNKKNLAEFAEDVDWVAGVINAFQDFYQTAKVKN